MGRSLLVLHGYAAANEMIERHWPYWRKSGADILGVGREDSGCKWPEPIQTVNIGSDRYTDKDNLCRRLIDTFRYCLTLPYDDFCILEADAINIGPLPKHTGGLLTNRAGRGSDGFKGNQYFHCPWWADRETAQAIVQHGDLMIAERDIEQGWPDRFLGWLVEKFELPWTQVRAHSENTIDGEESIKRARRAVESGVNFVHGIKTEEVLRQVAYQGNLLDEIALKFGTDKSSAHHGYVKHYEAAFAPIRWKVKTVVEFGVLAGQSLYTWAEYFPNATIWGVDIEERVKIEHPRIKFRKGSQADSAFSVALREEIGWIDILIDDAGHFASDQMNCFTNFWCAIAPGGTYWIEDLHTDGHPEYLGKAPYGVMEFIKHLTDEVNEQSAGFDGRPRGSTRIESLTLFKSLCCLRRFA